MLPIYKKQKDLEKIIIKLNEELRLLVSINKSRNHLREEELVKLINFNIDNYNKICELTNRKDLILKKCDLNEFKKNLGIKILDNNIKNVEDNKVLTTNKTLSLKKVDNVKDKIDNLSKKFNFVDLKLDRVNNNFDSKDYELDYMTEPVSFNKSLVYNKGLLKQLFKKLKREKKKYNINKLQKYKFLKSIKQFNNEKINLFKKIKKFQKIQILNDRNIPLKDYIINYKFDLDKLKLENNFTKKTYSQINKIHKKFNKKQFYFEKYTKEIKNELLLRKEQQKLNNKKLTNNELLKITKLKKYINNSLILKDLKIQNQTELYKYKMENKFKLADNNNLKKIKNEIKNNKKIFNYSNKIKKIQKSVDKKIKILNKKNKNLQSKISKKELEKSK